MENFPGFVVESAFQFPPVARTNVPNDAELQRPFDLEGSVCNLGTIDTIRSILGLEESSVVDCELSRRYLDQEKHEINKTWADLGETKNTAGSRDEVLGPSSASEDLGSSIESTWPFRETDLDFCLTPSEVKTRAAWSWRRTAWLCRKQADSVQAGDVPGIDYSPMMQAITSGLRDRASKALSYATSLDPDSTSKDMSRAPDWAVDWTEQDSEYYAEMALNYRMGQYATANKEYREAARRYIIEAIFTYLADQHYLEIVRTRETPAGAEALLLKVLCQGTSLPRIWAEAVTWSMTKGPLPPRIQYFNALVEQHGGKVARPRNPRNDFREWWLRAALAMGHSDWLDGELSGILLALEDRQFWAGPESGDADEKGHADGIAKMITRWHDFRIASPPSVEDYDKDSEIRTKTWLWKIEHASDDEEEEDVYRTLYNAMYADHEHNFSLESGEDSKCFTYGCPVRRFWLDENPGESINFKRTVYLQTVPNQDGSRTSSGF